jgi:50S ribosomal protein L16 3-hydroxylase
MLGGMTPSRFLGRHWQKRPLLVRGAFDGVGGLLSPAHLMQLAGRQEAE